MTFISLEFYGLLLITLLVYYILPLKYRWLALLAGSISFYVIQGVVMLPFMLAAAFVGWIAGVLIDKKYAKALALEKENPDDKEKIKEIREDARKKAKTICVIGILIIVLTLVWFKVVKYIPGSMFEAIVVPIGISYYTFSLIAYIVDVFWKKHQIERNFLKFVLFVSFFPKILQGPISRFKNLASQLTEGHKFEYKSFCFGLQLFLWGLFKKLVIADRLSIFTSQIFDGAEKRAGSIVLVAAIFSAFELYCDFSGCMDMAGGISELFGIKLEKNFNHPFFSKNAAEFWRRWHITLGTWFKDYIYMPMVTSKWMSKLLFKAKQKVNARFAKSLMTIIPLTVVWLLTGLWHGTGLPYIIWGIYWGVIIMISQVWAPEIKKLVAFLHINTAAESYKIFQMVRTFMLFVIGRIITVPGNISNTLTIIKNMFTKFEAHHLVDHSLYEFGINEQNFWLCIFMFIVLWAVSMLQEKGSLRERVAGYNIVVRWLLIYACIVAILVFGIYGPGYEASSFMYIGY